MKRYSVSRRQASVRAIVDALELCGATILESPDPRLAPFVTKILTPQGEQIRLVMYAFTANEYRQAGRPADEHRFQVKYGSDFKNYHQLYIADGIEEVTLMFGVHLELGLFVAVDPVMHEWTRFSRSIEFKEADLKQARDTGWHGWERDRSIGRRNQPAPKDNLRTEALLSFRPKEFLRYVNLERVASGMDTGERLLLAERWPSTTTDSGLMGAQQSSMPPMRHPLEVELGMNVREVLDMIGGTFRLKAAVRGSAAEHHLGLHLNEVSQFSDVESLDQDGQPDFAVTYKSKRYLIECKNVLRKTNARGACKVDFQKTRASKNDPCSRYYRPGQFHVLAACLHAVTEKWEFRFAPTTSLSPHPKCTGRLASNVVVDGVGWGKSAADAIDSA